MKTNSIKCVLCGRLEEGINPEIIDNGVCHGCEEEIVLDPIVKDVTKKYKDRSRVGINKYGTTLKNSNASLPEWINHIQEELMDATLYLERAKQDIHPSEKVTRLEVIDVTGRAYSKWNCTIDISYQDNGRTLKVFVYDK